MYELEKAIRDAIDYHLLGSQMLAEDAHAGDTAIKVGSAARLPAGTEIALYDGVNDHVAIERLMVCEVLSEQWLSIAPPLASDWEASVIDDTQLNIQSIVQKTHEGEFVQFVVQGNPPSIPRYPAITVEVTGNDNDVLTLGAVGVFSQEFGVRVTVWGEKSTYADSRKQVQKLASRVETALFKTVFPVVNPWVETTLAADMEPEQDWFIVADGNGLSGPIPLPIYIQSFDARYPTQITMSMGPNAFYIDRVYPRKFYADLTKIIRPRVHVYDSFCDGVTMDESPDNLVYATVDYRAKVARIRQGEPFL